MTDRGDRPMVRPDLLWEQLDGEVVAWSPDGAALHRLDGTATAVFLLLDGTRTAAAVVTALAARYDAPEDVLDRDVAHLLDELVRIDLVTVSR